MRCPRSVLLLLFALLVPAAATAQDGASSAAADEAGVRRALEHYLAGHATGEAHHFRAAFHPEAKLFWVRDGELMQRTAEEYASGASGHPAADEAERRRRVVSIDVAGSVATARIELDYPRARFVDFMSLVRVGDEWRIVNKIFHVEPKPAPDA